MHFDNQNTMVERAIYIPGKHCYGTVSNRHDSDQHFVFFYKSFGSVPERNARFWIQQKIHEDSGIYILQSTLKGGGGDKKKDLVKTMKIGERKTEKNYIKNAKKP